MGPAWKFRGWPWDGKPFEIFSKSKCSSFTTILGEEYKV
jgi:hypothetical protein